MLSLQSLSFLHNKPILSLERLNHYVNNPSPSVVARAVENNNSQNSKFEIDPEEARQALQRLDQQLKSLSNKQISSPKIKGTSLFFFLFFSCNSILYICLIFWFIYRYGSNWSVQLYNSNCLRAFPICSKIK